MIINNASNIYAEDVKNGYDSTLFEFVKAEPSNNGLQIYHQETSSPGVLRFIVASKDEQYGINGSGKQLLKLTFKAKNTPGTGKVEAKEGLVADKTGAEIVATVSGKDITVVGGFDVDVNSDGKYSLGDLAITGFNFGKEQAQWTTPKVDVNKNSSVEDTDLSLIVDKILHP
ncbi:cohesin domain-containing protein [Brevibacillus sp. SYSU BS000544]|uniref:cohesin domain-containing protein n=1 Tax=Brevibacillus sp. SYSU BS000544 TaxID=3416443 RepID=UPI003CE4CCC2